jgi:DNA polymerase III delta' subunit
VSFDGVLGQGPAIRALRAALRTGRLEGAYLFHGPCGVGKHRTAIEFARAVLCEAGGDDACEACSSCRRSASGVHPGLHLVGDGDDVTSIPIEAVREVQTKLTLRPLEGLRQVLVVDNADRMQEAAGNALLKTLEEPPRGVVLVLVVGEVLRVLETIRSRCRPVRFRPLGPGQVREVLEERGIDADAAEELARYAGGSAGQALRRFGLGFPGRAREIVRRFLDVGRDDPSAIARDLLLTPGRAGDGEAPAPAKRSKAAEARLAAVEVLTLLAHLARDAMLASLRSAGLPTSLPEEDVNAALARLGRDPERWGKQLRRFLEAAHNVVCNVGIDMVVVDLLLDTERLWSRTSKASKRPRSATAR